MYKLTKPDGFDFYSDTINYRNAIGTIIRVTDYDPPEKGAYGRGLHASRNPNDCFVGAKVPCAAFLVKGINKIAGDATKSRYQALKILKEITDLNSLFGWNYTEVINPIDPFKIEPPVITEKELTLLKTWNSVGNFVGLSVWNSVRDSVRLSVKLYMGDFVGNSVRDSVRLSVRDSVRDYMGLSVWNFVGAYFGSLFPNIEKWEYIKHKKGIYPFQSAVDLWKSGLVSSYDGEIWRLHGKKKAEILWEGKI